MSTPDEASVRRTEPEAAADEGYPIAEDPDRKRRAASFARAAIGSMMERPIPDPDVFRLAERFVREHPEGTQDEFIASLKEAS